MRVPQRAKYREIMTEGRYVPARMGHFDVGCSVPGRGILPRLNMFAMDCQSVGHLAGGTGGIDSRMLAGLK